MQRRSVKFITELNKKMKKRNSFVANSSTSSFIISTDGDKKEMGLQVKLKIDMTEYIKDTCTTIVELHNTENWQWFDEETQQQLETLIESGREVHFGSVCSDSGDPTELVLYNLQPTNFEDEVRVEMWDY